nr:hypothetical protein Itr_chr04CG10430 [Ipomoea trifida]
MASAFLTGCGWAGLASYCLLATPLNFTHVSLTPRSSSQISRNVTGSSSEIHSLSALSPKRRRLASRRHALKSPLSRQAVKLSSQASPAQFFELCD